MALLCERMGLPLDPDEEKALAKLDADGSSTVELEEWVSYWLHRVSTLPNPVEQQEIIARNTFARFDVDASNSIDASEFKELIESLGASFTDDEIDDVISLLDTDRNGTIDMDEFLAWWTQRSASLRYGSSSIALKLRKLATKATQRFSTDIFTAAWEGDEGLVKAFIDGDKRACLACDSEHGEWTALHYASYRGHLRITELLVKGGAKPDRTNAAGFTPLFYAAQQGHLEECSLLLELGADPTIWGVEDQVWMCALDHCVDTPELIKIFAAHSSSPVPNLSEVTSITASINPAGLLTLSLPTQRSISSMPIRTWIITIRPFDGEKETIGTYRVNSLVPSEKQIYSVQLKKSTLADVIAGVKEQTLCASVVAEDALHRRGESSPFISISSIIS